MLKYNNNAILIAFLLFTYGCDKHEPIPSDANATGSTSNIQKTRSSAEHAAELTCYTGEIGSRSSCSTVFGDPNNPHIPNDMMTKHTMTCGHLNEVSKINWVFIEHREGKDVYNFERIFPLDTHAQTTTAKVVEYEGKQIIVFQDEYQVVVLNTPN